MSMEKKKAAKQSPIDRYEKGYLKAMDHISLFCKSEIDKVKLNGAMPDTPRQITNGGKVNAYNKVIQKTLSLIKNKGI